MPICSWLKTGAIIKSNQLQNAIESLEFSIKIQGDIKAKHSLQKFGAKSNMNSKFCLIFLIFSICEGKIRVLIDGQLEQCDPNSAMNPVYNCDVEFLVEEDETCVNGNASFSADIDVWKASFWTEMKMGSSWIPTPIKGSNIDVCKSFIDEREILYPFLNGLATCPFKKGVCINKLKNIGCFFKHELFFRT